MDTKSILDILSSKRTRKGIIEALEILGNPNMSIRDCAEEYQKHEQKKLNKNSHRTFVSKRQF